MEDNGHECAFGTWCVKIKQMSRISARSSALAANYLSQRSADVILSEIRPTKLAPEAVRSINVFLDELLWTVLRSARSFSTDRLKSALGKIIPTSLGKDAVLEAEMELKSYLERTTTSNGATKAYTESTQDFPLHAAFEVRLIGQLSIPLLTFHDVLAITLEMRGILNAE